MRHSMIVAVLAASLLATGAAGAPSESEIYRKSIECGALHGFYSGLLEEEDPDAALGNEDMSTRYFIMAANREQGDSDNVIYASQAEAERLAAFMENPNVTEAELDAFFGERNEYCDAFNAEVAEEFDAIDLSE